MPENGKKYFVITPGPLAGLQASY